MQKKEYTIEVGGRVLKALFTDLADQAHGSVIVSYDETTVLATAVMSKNPKEGDFFPLTVDYEERFYAGGKILGSRFVRREGKPTDEAILSGRIVDRTIRPLFDQDLRHEVQVIITVLSLGKGDTDAISVIAASLALGVSNIPWNGPVSCIKIGKNKGEDAFSVNPGWEEQDLDSKELSLLACGKDSFINMIEVGAREPNESIVMKALEKASEEIEKIQTFQKEIIAHMGKKKRVIQKTSIPETVLSLFEETISPRIEDVVFSGPGNEKIGLLEDEWMTLLQEKLPTEASFGDKLFEEKVNTLIHKGAVEKNRRADGRNMDEIRPLFVQAGGISSLLHGSGIFYRGGTHVLSVLTLGGPQDSQLIDGMEGEENKRFMHHYNFPPFSTGETGRVGSTNRRMIGHGALAEKALSAVIPSKETFPYTIRIVSEALASNGSTSMGSVCGSTLALMDAGVPIKAPVAGIASGLMMSPDFAKDGKYKVLTDIQGPEDHHGDMDFKVAGTREGITAVQMDIKVGGIPLKILAEAFEKARVARLTILDLIEKEIAAPRPKLSPYAPQIIVTKIKQNQIGLVIGTGGKTIKEIKEKTGAEIDIDDDGTVFITGKNGSAEKAREIIDEMTREYKAGDAFEGEVIKVTDFGIFVRIGTNAEGLVHVSEMAPWRIEKIQELVKVGDRVPVSVREIDEKGRINLSIKKTTPHFFKKPGESVEQTKQ